jgi:hypothetical protein
MLQKIKNLLGSTRYSQIQDSTDSLLKNVEPQIEKYQTEKPPNRHSTLFGFLFHLSLLVFNFWLFGSVYSVGCSIQIEYHDLEKCMFVHCSKQGTDLE